MTPDIQSLRDKAKAAIEGRTGGDFKAIRAYEDAAKPETILSLIEALEKAEDNALEKAAKYLDDIGEDDSAHVIRNLKGKTP